MEENNKEPVGEESNQDVAETQIIMPKRKHRLSKSARKYLIYSILIILVTGLTLFYLLKEDPNAIITNLATADWRYVLVIVALVLCAALIAGANLTLLARNFNKKYKYPQGVVNGLIGSFFSNVTPFASGGQFVQVYTFTRQSVKASNAASVLVMQFIIFQSALLLYAMVAFIAGFENIMSRLGNVTLLGISFSPLVLSIIGFIINVFTIGSLFVLAFCRPLHRLVLNNGINLLAKIRLVKNPEKKRNDLTVQVASFRVEFKRLITNWKIMVPCFILAVCRLTCNYAVPFFAGKAVGANMDGDFLNSLWSSSYLAMITSFIPIPGGSGGAEWGFQSLFLSLIDNNATLTYSANILWRGLTYYLLTILGGLTFALYRGKPKVSTEKVADTQTFKELDLTPFIKHSYLKDYEMLEARYKKMDEKKEKKAEILSSEEVIQSFKEISNNLEDTSVEYNNDEMTEKTKKYLKNVMQETEQIENQDRDPEIQKAIESDKIFLDNERNKRIEKKKAKKAKKEGTNNENRDIH